MRYVSAKANPVSQLLKFQDTALPRTSGNGKRVALVISKTDHEDLELGALLGDGGTPRMIYDAVFRYAGVDIEDLNLVAIPCDAFAVGRKSGAPSRFGQLEDASAVPSKDVQEILDAENEEYVLSRLEKFKPQIVLAFGAIACAMLSKTRDESPLTNQFAQFTVGVPQRAAIGDTRFILTGVPCPTELCSGKKPERTINLLGQTARWIEAGLAGDLLYKIRTNYAETAKIIVVDTMAKFEEFLDVLWAQPVWSVDTEAKNLLRIANSLQILQMADSEDRCYVIPIKHFDAPWSPDELHYILDSLGDYFYDNDADYHIYHNAAFDIPMLRSELGISHYCADVYDTMAGEFVLDENVADLSMFYEQVNRIFARDHEPVMDEDDEDDGDKKAARRVGHYSLLNFCIQHGNYEYLTGEFGKESRVGISGMPFYDTPDLIRYCALDALVLFGLVKAQQARARDCGNPHFMQSVRKLISDQINTFGTMSATGEMVDVEYLWWINSNKSPIYSLVEELKRDLLNTPEVIDAEKLLLAETGRSKTRKIGDIDNKRFFDFGKADHREALFRDVMKLETPEFSESGKPSYGKLFKEEYEKDQPIIAKYAEYGKADKLKKAFLAPLLKICTVNADTLKDLRVRASYIFMRIVTGRVASVDPNMQQVPSHGKLAKVVKRAFVAPKGSLFIKVDFSAHELRLWAIISQCVDLSAAFQKGLNWIAKFRKEPKAEYAQKFATEGDIHRMNTVTFGMASAPELVDDETRSAVKGIAFGSVYGRSLPTLARSLKMELDKVESVYKAFFKKLPTASNWLLQIEKVAQKNFWVESLMHRRRHLFGLMLYRVMKDNKRLRGVMNALGRRARNSPIQGMGSDLGFCGARLIEKIVWAMTKHVPRWRKTLPLKNCNMVHDSSEMEAVYSFILPSIEVIEYGLTLGNQQKAKELYGMDFTVDLAIEMEIGPNLAMMEKWAVGFRDKMVDGKPVLAVDEHGNHIQKLDKKGNPAFDKKGNPEWKHEQILAGDFDHLYDIIENALNLQVTEHKYDIDVDEVLHKIFVPRNTPKFLVALAKAGMFKHSERFGYDVYDDSEHLTIEQKVEALDFNW